MPKKTKNGYKKIKRNKRGARRNLRSNTWGLYKAPRVEGAFPSPMFGSPLVELSTGQVEHRSTNAQITTNEILNSFHDLPVDVDPVDTIRNHPHASVYVAKRDASKSAKQRGHCDYPIPRPENDSIAFFVVQIGSKPMNGARLALYFDYERRVIVRGPGFSSTHSKVQDLYQPDWTAFDAAIPWDASWSSYSASSSSASNSEAGPSSRASRSSSSRTSRSSSSSSSSDS